MPPATPNVTDWMQGIGTVVGALAAIGAFIYAVRAYRGQAKELTDLTKERRREADERRREQVSQVFVWWEQDTPDTITYRIRNRSPYPIYTVVVQVHHDGLPKEQQAAIPHLLPGEEEEFYPDFSPAVLEQFRRCTRIVVAEVTDAAQNRWHITSQGRIDPIEVYRW